jgi:hypothetical protein
MALDRARSREAQPFLFQQFKAHKDKKCKQIRRFILIPFSPLSRKVFSC